MRLKHFQVLVYFLFLSVLVSAQKDSGKTVSNKHESIEGQIYISGGIGQSTILSRIYYVVNAPDNPAYGVSQSVVYNGIIDYGISKKLSIGAGIAYQTATGVPYTGSSNQIGLIENLSRLNISTRILSEVASTKNFEFYIGFRVGVSYWTDITIPYPVNQLTLGNTYTRNISFQFPIGIRYFINYLGLHIEAAIGTPYFIEAGLTIRIGKAN